MEIEKLVLDEIERCYCVGAVERGGERLVLMASEAVGGPCYAYGGERFEKREAVWESAGGTMSIVPVPGTDGDFLAVQSFFPGFQSAGARVVWCRYIESEWRTRVVLELPYLHRFDILRADGVNYFLGATLCGSKKDREDWSDPGKVWVGEVPADWDRAIAVAPLLEGIVKNHGYWRGEEAGRPVGYVTGDSGIYAVKPPAAPGGTWTAERRLDMPTSDVAVCDLDGDGEAELVTIEPFHGDAIRVRRADGRVAHAYSRPVAFAHALWAGQLLGGPAAIGGVRRADGELFLLRYDEAAGGYTEEIIEVGVGPANVLALDEPEKHRALVVSANHTKNEAAVYILRDGQGG